MKKIKFLKKINFLCENHIFRGGTWKCQRATKGTPRSSTQPDGAAVCGRASTWCGAHMPPTCSLSFPCLSLPQKITFGQLKFTFLLLISCDFDLHIQLLYVAEIWCISSPVCDSFEYPIGILFNGVYMKYFAAVDILFSEFECLF